MLRKMRKPLIGMLFITTPRFRDLGEGTEHGPYHRRKEAAVGDLMAEFEFADTVFPGIVYTRDDIRAAIAEFTRAGVDMVFAHFLSWSDDYAWVRFLRDMAPVPIYFAGIVRDELGFRDSLSEDRFVEFLSAGGLVGLLEASGSAARFARPMMKCRMATQREILEDVRAFAAAACLRKVLRQVTFALLPSMNEVMWSTYVDPYTLFMAAGPEMRFIGVAELVEHIAAIPREATRAAMDAILAAYPRHGDINMEKMAASVEASLALEAVARNYGAELLVLNDIDQTLLRQVGLRPGFTPCPGTDDVMVVPEGDIGGGLACYILAKLTGGHVGYIEPFHIDRAAGVFHGGHAGPNDYTDPMGMTLISTDTRFAKSAYKHAGAPFAWHVFSPGEKTMLHVSQCGNGFKMVCSVVDCLPCEHFLAGYTHGVFQSRTSAAEFFTSLQNIGVTQHYSIVDGNHMHEMRTLASLLQFEFCQV